MVVYKVLSVFSRGSMLLRSI